MKSIQELIKGKPIYGWLLFIGTMIIVFFIGLLSSTIIERRSEGNYTLQMLKPLADYEPRNEVWGENFPREYESYRKTLDTTFKSKYGGVTKKDYLAESPELVILWAGYSFSKEYIFK